MSTLKISSESGHNQSILKTLEINFLLEFDSSGNYHPPPQRCKDLGLTLLNYWTLNLKD